MDGNKRLVAPAGELLLHLVPADASVVGRGKFDVAEAERPVKRNEVLLAHEQHAFQPVFPRLIEQMPDKRRSDSPAAVTRVDGDGQNAEMGAVGFERPALLDAFVGQIGFMQADSVRYAHNGAMKLGDQEVARKRFESLAERFWRRRRFRRIAIFFNVVGLFNFFEGSGGSDDHGKSSFLA